MSKQDVELIAIWLRTLDKEPGITVADVVDLTIRATATATVQEVWRNIFRFLNDEERKVLARHIEREAQKRFNQWAKVR